MHRRAGRGLALVSGDMLRKTVAMLGDWDLHSTLLRRAVRRLGRAASTSPTARGLGEPYAAMLVRSRGGARAATEAAFAVDREGGGAGPRGWSMVRWRGWWPG